MNVKINPKKSHIIIEKIKNFLDHKKATTRKLASVIGSCISLFSALPLGKLHYGNLEKEKTKALKTIKGVSVQSGHAQLFSSSRITLVASAHSQGW